MYIRKRFYIQMCSVLLDVNSRKMQKLCLQRPQVLKSAELDVNADMKHKTRIAAQDVRRAVASPPDWGWYVRARATSTIGIQDLLVRRSLEEIRKIPLSADVYLA